MARCGCSSDCPCAVRSGSCVRVVGSGAPGTPYVVSLVLDPSADNILQCAAGGLTAALPDPAVVVESTDSIDMVGSGTPADPIMATPRLDSGGGNNLSSSINGLMGSSVGKPLFLPGAVSASGTLSYGQLALVDSTVGDITLVLPSLGAMVGACISIKKMVAVNNVIIQGYGIQEIEGSPTVTLSGQWSSVTIINSGITWIKLMET